MTRNATKHTVIITLAAAVAAISVIIIAVLRK